LETLAPEATRIVIDLPDPEADREALGTALALERHPYTRDLAWFGITRWREFVAQFFDPPGMSETLSEIRSVSVRVTAPAAVVRPPRVGAWLIAWLAGQLGWKPRGRPAFTGDCLTASFETESAQIDIRMEVAVDSRTRLCRISAIELQSDPTSNASTRVTGPDQRGEATGACFFKVSRSAEAADEVLLEACRGESRALPRTLRAPEFDTAHRLAAALESAREDPPYRDALPIALWLLAPN
jgi:glucose-6-phosphate dehydrogenase assembly protein OpcA